MPACQRCKSRAEYGLPGGDVVFCTTHKKAGMVKLLGSKRCDHHGGNGGCDKRPSFGLPGDAATRCGAHREADMVDVVNKRCDHPGGCTTQPRWGHPDAPRTRCAEHKEPGMLNKVLRCFDRADSFLYFDRAVSFVYSAITRCLSMCSSVKISVSAEDIGI